jgi:hypothetical protein
MIEKFHDEDYDGVVLKIPAIFIFTNELQDFIKEIEAKLSDASCCIYHPDHLNNLYEIENMDVKKQMVREKMAERKARETAQMEYSDKINSGEIFELVWGDIIDSGCGDPIKIGGKYSSDREMYNKKSIKKSYLDYITSHIQEYNNLESFLIENPLFVRLADSYKDSDPSYFMDIRAYETTDYAVGVRFKRVMVKELTHSKDRYRTFPLQLKDNQYGYDKFNSFVSLAGYRRNGSMKLIKER